MQVKHYLIWTKINIKASLIMRINWTVIYMLVRIACSIFSSIVLCFVNKSVDYTLKATLEHACLWFWSSKQMLGNRGRNFTVIKHLQFLWEEEFIVIILKCSWNSGFGNSLFSVNILIRTFLVYSETTKYFVLSYIFWCISRLCLLKCFAVHSVICLPNISGCYWM